MEFELSNKKIENLLLDKSVEEIMINGPGRVYVVRAGISTLSELFVSEDEIDVLIEQLLKNTGRRVDKSHPFVDASLPDGSRLHIVIPDITRRFPAINIRKFPQLNLNLRDFISQGVLSNQQADFLEFAVTSGANIVVAGGTGAGKTTFLRALLNTHSKHTRIITCEEVFELHLSSLNVVQLQTRDSGLEGTGEITLRDLVKGTLRMRPERIVVGEVRGPEAFDLLIALNSGMPGAGTVHANSASEALAKLTMLPLSGGLNIQQKFVESVTRSVIDLIIQIKITKSGFRKVAEILPVSGKYSLDKFLELEKKAS
jgi:pilus assembly protein CpaF